MVTNRQTSLKTHFSNRFPAWFYYFSEVENVLKLLDLQSMGLYGVAFQDKDQTVQKKDVSFKEGHRAVNNVKNYLSFQPEPGRK